MYVYVQVNLYDVKVLVLEPSKVLMPSYVAVNKNANEEGEVDPYSCLLLLC